MLNFKNHVQILKVMTTSFAPFMCHLAEDIYQHTPQGVFESTDFDSVFAQKWPHPVRTFSIRTMFNGSPFSNSIIVFVQNTAVLFISQESIYFKNIFRYLAYMYERCVRSLKSGIIQSLRAFGTP